MRGFILAAGFGTRLLPLTSHLNKAMVPLAGRPMLSHSISFLKGNGIETIGVNTHYLSHQIEEFRKKSGFNFELFYEKPKILGTAGALYNASQFLKKDEIFIVANVDIIASFDLQKIVSMFKKSEWLCALLAFKNSKSRGTIVFNTEDKRYIGTFKEIELIANKYETADFIGFTIYRREFINFLTSADFSITDVWARAIKKGISMGVEIIEKGYWKDVGTPFSLASAHFDIIDEISPITLPKNMVRDKTQKVCIPSFLLEKHKHIFGRYCWIENVSFIPEEIVENCVVLENGDISLHKAKRNFILTKWGEIVFDGQ
ncbi:MAG: sugar phosphate nucleotidyltransferase [Chitinispirillaceae bacterium]|nr:sugar phosphate nucleotidyltransferase [Chitinispirillaceae bacterium]